MEVEVFTLKRLVFIGVTIIVVVTISVGGLLFSKSIKSKADSELLNKSITLSNTIIKLRQGKDSLTKLKESDNTLSNKVLSDIDKYRDDLKSLNDIKFNVTDYYEQNFNHEDENYLDEFGAGAGDDGEITEDDTISEESEYIEENSTDDRIFTEDGIDYVHVRDLDFSTGNEDIILYNGEYLTITKDEVPQTYDMLTKDADNILKYKSHKVIDEKTRSYIDISYESMYNGNKRVLVRVYNNGKDITDFEVRE